jgi:hypothetical protein
MTIEVLKKMKRHFEKFFQLNVQSNAHDILCWLALSLFSYLSPFYTRIQVSLTPLRLFEYSIFHSRSDLVTREHISLLAVTSPLCIMRHPPLRDRPHSSLKLTLTLYFFFYIQFTHRVFTFLEKSMKSEHTIKAFSASIIITILIIFSLSLSVLI